MDTGKEKEVLAKLHSFISLFAVGLSAGSEGESLSLVSINLVELFDHLISR